MSEIRAAATPTPDGDVPPYSRTAAQVLATAGSDAATGLTAAEAASRLSSHGRNEITAEKPPSPVGRGRPADA